ncbi:MAG: gfo/Idh/MocA family oxidoreductase, partial [Gemmatimonadota bacterium]|nr:gfo/Idh/MocA family oxidoreductase [Gemmatimonadota bacterium]
DTGSGETGNNGPHYTDFSRWALQKYELPKTIHSTGGYYGFDCDQETPNTQISVMQYEDGKIVQLEVRGLYTNEDANEHMGILFFGTEGWMKMAHGEWSTYYGRKNEPGQSMTSEQAKERQQAHNTRGGGGGPHFNNFIDAVRARDRSMLNAEILEGHLSASMCHLCNIAYQTGRTIEFDSDNENFPGDSEAESYLSRQYRYPFIVPEKV